MPRRGALIPPRRELLGAESDDSALVFVRGYTRLGSRTDAGTGGVAALSSLRVKGSEALRGA